MLISEYLDKVREDLKLLGDLGGGETAELVERLAAAAEPALRAHFLDAVNGLVQEFNVQDPVALTLNLEGDQVRLSRLVAPSAPTSPATGDLSARIALRLSDELKENIEHLASDVGSSVNSWIVRALERSVRSDASSPSVRVGRQLRGRGRA